MEEDTQVGYGQPPKDTRFKPGTSGNPGGRPKKPRTLVRDLLEIMYEPIARGEGAGAETHSMQSAILRALAAKALEGDVKAMAMVLEMVQRLSYSYGGPEHVMRED